MAASKVPDTIDLLDSDEDRQVGKKGPMTMKQRRSPPTKKAKRGGSKTSPSNDTIKSSSAPGEEATTGATESNTKSSLAFASYNVWFGREAGGKPHPNERMKELVNELLSSNGAKLPYPLLLGLQEVSLDLVPLLLPLLESAGYDIVLQELNQIMPYGCAVCVNTSLKVVGSGFTPFQQTMMGRGIVWAVLEVAKGKEVLFTTSHLESFVGAEQNDMVGRNREAQARQWKSFCEKCMEKRPTVELAICTADWNWDDVRIGARRTTKGPDKNLMEEIFSSCPTDLSPWIDCWHESHPNEAGCTYDAKENPMLGGNLRRRFDRCLVLARKQVAVSSMDLIGTKAIPGLAWDKTNQYNSNVRTVQVLPSDHYGLIVDIEF